ncbi:MAG TPA: winged helix-turn-helix domain-containing protein [Acidimicrobiia bacterium]|nr:winged helix-turn-helix domain-containing protein [Acidimicrobiia bacterium]
MADHKTAPTAPDYELDLTLQFETNEQYKALFEDTRLQIVDLLLERAATIKELSETLGKPKGTIGHHVGVLEDTGLIRVVRTEMVRAIEAKYYGRTARTYILGDMTADGFELAPDHFLTTAAAEFARADEDAPVPPSSTLRYARIADERAQEWIDRLLDLVHEFTAEPRGGETTYGLLVAMYPTDRPHLPDPETS